MGRRQRSRTVLIVEDDHDARRALESRLLRSGFRVVSAGSGMEALQLACHHVPDAITMDIRLGDMEGTEVVRRLLEHESTRSIPVIFVTGHIHPQSASEDFLKGRFFLRKPYDPQLLLLALDRVIDGAAVPADLAAAPRPVPAASGWAWDAAPANMLPLAPDATDHDGPVASAVALPTQAELVDEFSHDARSLLFVIAEMTYAMTAETCGSLEHQDLARVIRDRTAELAGLCDMLLTGTRFAQGGLTPIFEPVAVRHLLRDVLLQVRRWVRRRKGIINVKLRKGLPNVRCDLELMRTAVVSLLSGILQATGNGNVIQIRSGTCRLRSGSGVRLSLSVSSGLASWQSREVRVPGWQTDQIVSSAKFRLADHLAQACGARICISGRPTALVVTLLLPAAE